MLSVIEKDRKSFPNISDFARSVGIAYVGAYDWQDAFDQELFADEVESMRLSTPFLGLENVYQRRKNFTKEIFYRNLKSAFRKEPLKFVDGFDKLFDRIRTEGFVGSESDFESKLKNSNFVHNVIYRVSFGTTL
jgi:hypothetical protein